MRMIKTLALASLILFANTQNASAREFGDIYTECGLGATIFPNHEIMAAISNVTWDLGTTAIISNASSPDTCKGGSASTAALIYHTYPQLEAEFAKGDGDHLRAMLTVAGCKTDAHPSMIGALRSDFASLVDTEGYSANDRYTNAENLFNVLTKSLQSDFAAACAS